MEQIILRKSKKTDIYEVIARKPLSEAEKARLLYESRQKMEWDNQARERGARLEGILLVEKNMIKRNRPIDEIIEDTGLTLDEVEGLRNAE